METRNGRMNLAVLTDKGLLYVAVNGDTQEAKDEARRELKRRQAAIDSTEKKQRERDGYERD
jgi:hypothetical protein